MVHGAVLHVVSGKLHALVILSLVFWLVLCHMLLMLFTFNIALTSLLMALMNSTHCCQLWSEGNYNE